MSTRQRIVGMARSKPAIAERRAAQEENACITVFATRLGWMALVERGGAVERLSFGHPSEAAARRALPKELLANAEHAAKATRLAARLQAYADGKPDDFADVQLSISYLSPFQIDILEHCRRIPYGATWSYAELARRAGRPGAARAVGNCMALNPVPIIVPCHRVVRADGRLGHYSALGGTATKQRLLAMEAEIWPRIA